MTNHDQHPAGAPATGSALRGGGRGRFTLGLGLVLLLNGLLIVRPEELFSGLAGLRLYQLVIASCLVWYCFSILGELSWQRLSRNPLLFLILGVQAAVVLSHVGNARIGEGLSRGAEFAKLVAYYLVMVAALRTRSSVRWFFAAFLAFVVVQTTLGLAQYFGYADFEALRQFEQRERDGEGEGPTTLLRLCGCGIYNDPNDLCLLLTAGMLICLNRFLSSGGFARAIWLLPFGYFGFALTLTHSRGGLLMAAAGLFAYATARYGGRRGVLLLLLAAPLALVALGGRQTRFDLSSREDTSQARIQLWSDALALVPSHPLFGLGAGELPDEIGLAAHNSYVHAYAELGPAGGAMFTAAFALALFAVVTTRPPKTLPTDASRELAGFRLILIGMLASYMMGMLSLSRIYIPPTYLGLALATIYLRLAAPHGPRWFAVDGRLMARVAVIGVAGLVFFKLFVMTFARFG